MQHSTGHFDTSDGLSIFTQSWQPDDKPRAAIVLAHGIGEHSGRYSEFATLLADKGFAVFALDHRGHGHSDGLRVHTESFDLFSNDLYRYIEHIRRDHPQLPIILMGHSMGSVISLMYALDHQDRLSGLIISGCAIHAARVHPQFLRPILRAAARFIPKLPIVPGIPPEQLSNDPAIIQNVKDDPLVHSGPSRPGILYGIVSNGDMIHAQAEKISVPLLVVHGGDDPVCPVSASQHLYDQVSSTDKKLHIYPGMKHEIIWGFEKEPVIKDIVAWLEARF